MSRDDSYLLDMLLWARRVQSFNQDVTGLLFAADVKDQAATLHGLQVIGEAAGKVSQQFQDAHPEIKWPQIIGLRHRLVHDYGRIETSIIWDIVQNDVPPLIGALEPLVPPEEPREPDGPQ
jgi:uncharacterized protein with HEPN domain